MLNNEKNFRLKSGVSLITVLLFMLVATIAATATYKLLSSGGFSSTSRMRQQEAYQSALAGIENTRMWMTFHANDVGALVKAFIEGGNKPINLDARVRQWQRAKQDYHVWLTGVNTENSTYKLKILSSGVSQIVKDANTEETVAQWNESAIFSVDGLYQVRLLKEEVEEVVASLPFKYNYFGGSTQTQGHMKAYSMLINGDMYGSNPPYTEENLIVTGDVLITGNSVGAGGTACIGGNLNANNGVLGNDFYVGGNAKGFTFPSASEAAGVSRGELKGNVYIEDTLFAPKTSGQIFRKNLTLNFYAITCLQLLWTVFAMFIITIGVILDIGEQTFKDADIIFTLQWFTALGISIISYILSYFAITRIPRYPWKYTISLIAYIPTIVLILCWVIFVNN